jgi:hypothetical protein
MTPVNGAGGIRVGIGDGETTIFVGRIEVDEGEIDGEGWLDLGKRIYTITTIIKIRRKGK